MIQSPDELLGQLRDVTGPELTPPTPPAPWTLWVITAATLITLLLLLWRWMRQPKARPSARRSARQELARLPGQPTIESLNKFCWLMRWYLFRSRSVSAETLTAIELRAKLEKADEPWLTLLEASERDRFAGELPSQAEWSERLRQAATLLQAESGSPDGR